MLIMRKINLIGFLFILLFPNNSISQENVQPIEFFGKVTNNGKGVSGVAITDGVNVTQTDKNGRFKLYGNISADFVYMTIPSGYAIPMEGNSPNFYYRVNDKLKKKKEINFKLSKSDNDDNHIIVVCADPQVAFEEELPLLETATKDIKNHIDNNFFGKQIIGINCGDIVAEITNETDFFTPVKQLFYETGIPFFYASGNHDTDMNCRSNYKSKKIYENNFGPAYYSFNRGKIHYIVLDDVFHTGKSYSYIGYLEETQLTWLEQDLSLVPKGSNVVVVLHIPSFSREARKGDYNKEEINKVLQNRQILYKLLKPFNSHIFSGHEHYNENYIINDSLFEHVHAAQCGIFWQAPYSSDGTPLGYAIYEVNDDKINWYYKVIGRNKNYQFNAYPMNTDKNKPNAIIANIWNYDPKWKVYWYENNVKMGEMKQYSGWDPAIVDYVRKNEHHFRYKYIGAGITEHLFYAEPFNKNAKIKIEVIDRFNNVYSEEL